ncbi:MAG: fumarylacetoacetate hydrolase family protein [Deinococcus sp.]|nr:fumarylacetoacetate hydrolase family protein [Deinococcus sp.]
MQLCRFLVPGQGGRIGLVRSGSVIDLTSLDPRRFGALETLLSQSDLATELEKITAQPRYSFQELDRSPGPYPYLLPPIDTQEVWAAGVTYTRSRQARMTESGSAGSFYDRVYTAPRPELFFKATPHRTVGPNAPVVIRTDAKWNVPEPELALMLSPELRLVGYTIGNDMSSRDIEGENPLYLPQAKVYLGSCALGPVVTLAQAVPDPKALRISLVIRRGNQVAFAGDTSVGNMKRSFDELISYLGKDNAFPHGAILLTGTGVVPPDNFTLEAGDLLEISVNGIGTLRNPVRRGA